MKAYMGHSLEPREWAVLIFANSVREAKALFWSQWCGEIGDYIDMRVKLLPDEPLFNDQIKSDTPHIIDSPPSCEQCLCWGEYIGKDGICESCSNDNEY